MLLLTHNITSIAYVTIPIRLLLHSCGILVLFFEVCTDFLISFLDFLTQNLFHLSRVVFTLIELHREVIFAASLIIVVDIGVN